MPKFVIKVIELYQTFNVRFGVMTVGPTGGGKTTCCQLLQTAQTNLRNARTCAPTYATRSSNPGHPGLARPGQQAGARAGQGRTPTYHISHIT